jgi:hypothetical protein
MRQYAVCLGMLQVRLLEFRVDRVGRFRFRVKLPEFV